MPRQPAPSLERWLLPLFHSLRRKRGVSHALTATPSLLLLAALAVVPAASTCQLHHLFAPSSSASPSVPVSSPPSLPSATALAD